MQRVKIKYRTFFLLWRKCLLRRQMLHYLCYIDLYLVHVQYKQRRGGCSSIHLGTTINYYRSVCRGYLNMCFLWNTATCSRPCTRLMRSISACMGTRLPYIARNFRGLKFSRFSRINDEPRKFYPPKFYLRLRVVRTATITVCRNVQVVDHFLLHTTNR